MEEEEMAFHIVFTLHNSRTSQRMVKYGVRKGTIRKLSMEHEIELTRYIGEVILECGYTCLAYNICKDHVHLVLVCSRKELTGIVQRIKSVSSKMFNMFIQDGRNVLWSQKFYRGSLDDEGVMRLSRRVGGIYRRSHLENTLSYIKYNRVKHGLEESFVLEREISRFVTSLNGS